MTSTDPWLIAQGEEDGLPLLFRMRELMPEGVQPDKYPHLVNILWQFDTSGSGMPPDDVVDQMNEFEDRLDELEGAAIGYMMVSITGNGRKEWLWYVSDTDRYMQRVNRALAGAGARFPVDFQSSEDPTWETFRAFIGGVQQKQ
jgi:hypothetical protein